MLAVGGGVGKGLRAGVPPPEGQNLVRRLDQPLGAGVALAQKEASGL